MSKTIAVLFLVMLFPALLFSQKNGVIILINGKLTDKTTGQPVAANVRFMDGKGKIHQSNSNSLDGIFQQVLPCDASYDLFVAGYIPDDDKRSFNIPPYKEYVELNYEIGVTKISEGMPVISDNVFIKNESSVNGNFRGFLSYLKTFGDIQKGVMFDIIISSGDSYFAEKKAKESYVVKGKKKIRTITIKSKEQLSDLVEARIEAFKNEASKIGLQLRNVNFVSDVVVNKPKKAAKKNKKSSQTTDKEEVSLPNITLKINRIIKL